MKSFLKKPNNFFDSDIDTFDKFCKKYKKNNYISTIDKKRLASIGLDFENLQNKVKECIKYFNKQDIQLLHDLLYYVIDDIDQVTGFGNIWFSIDFNVGHSLKHEIVVSLDDTGLPSKEHKKIDNDELSIMNNIINFFYNKFNKEFELLKDKKNKDNWDKYIFTCLKNANINKIRLNPVINIDFEINEFKTLSSDLNNYLQKEILNRYFEQIKIEKNIYIINDNRYRYCFDSYNMYGTTIKIY